MPEHIPWENAKAFAEANGLTQVIITAFDDDGRTHVLTYGVTEADSVQAMEGGNFVKKALKWPEWTRKDEPPWLVELKARNRELEAELSNLRKRFLGD